ncbi:MAG: MBL fold metallo-hydrolase [Candidatus Aminicenantes bacterium]|nr:MBL fold metallo-hydrolase [Candidatus Aminicenantes bacterium]
MSPLTFSILYDNNPYKPEFVTDWGFSCLIQGLEKTILFDTGAKHEILLDNISKLGKTPELVDQIFLSHEHFDHTGGLEGFLALNSDVTVFIPDFFPNKTKKIVVDAGSCPVSITGPQKLLPGAFTTGVMNGWIKEQSLVLETDKGLILITGCAHPRITNIIAFTKDQFQRNIYLVFGGFHLGGFEDREIKEIIRLFRQAGIEKVGPTHCSGLEARTLFKEEYGKDFLELGAGSVWSIE